MPYSLLNPYFPATSYTRLSDNENPYAGEYCRYPDPNPVALQRLYLDFLLHEQTNYQVKDPSKPLTEENILFCNGSIEAIDLLLRSFCNPNVDRMCITSPTFVMFKHWALAYAIPLIEVPLKGESYQSLDVDQIIQSNAKILFLCNPNNPVGNVFPYIDILTVVKNFKGVIVIDEAYHEFGKSPSYIGLIDEFPNLVIIRTFSKAWGLAGLRAGAIIAEQSLLNAIECIKPPFSFSSSAQTQLKKALENTDALKKTWDAIIQERDRFRFALAKLACVDKIFPSSTNFLLIRFKNPLKILEALSLSSVSVNNSGNSIKDTLRISVGTPTETDRVIKILKNYRDG
jgi:histidinol-phosphate aminotransferase